MDSNFREAWALLPDYLSQHVLVSLAAIVLGTAISLPLAIVAARNRHLRGPLLGVASIVQTIPGLALLALFYPLLLALSILTKQLFGWSVPALGFLPSVLALTLYSMLPVLRNTVTALLGIDPAVAMAAKGVGMTERQSLFLVELPLAAPVIVAGIRTATVWVVGTATLSTPVGQTSLGNYIFTGLQTENWVLVLFGCVAAALLALVLDQLLALAGSGLAQRSRQRIVFAAVGLLIVLGVSLVPAVSVSGSAAPEIIIGAKNFDEQYILTDLMADRLNSAGFHATTRSDLGSTIAFHALAGKSIDMYIDYSGTLWANEMHRRDMPGRQAMLDQLRDWLARKYAITLYGSLGFENAYVFTMRADRAKALHIESLADLAAHARDLKVGGDFEIFSRPEWRSVIKSYGLDIRPAAHVPGGLPLSRRRRRRCRRHLRLLERRPHPVLQSENPGRSQRRAAALRCGAARRPALCERSRRAARAHAAGRQNLARSHAEGELHGGPPGRQEIARRRRRLARPPANALKSLGLLSFRIMDFHTLL